MNKESKEFYEMVRGFLTVYLPKQKAASPNTVRSYRTALNMYLNFSCRELEINLDSFGFHVSSRELLEGFLDYLEEECKCSIASRNQRLAANSTFFSICRRKRSGHYDLLPGDFFRPCEKGA